MEKWVKGTKIILLCIASHNSCLGYNILVLVETVWWRIHRYTYYRNKSLCSIKLKKTFDACSYKNKSIVTL